ncbi:MAG TPA: hypothetical protein VK453_07015 [Micromonosporaceae bacterium]|nr:hypothetical protein [Micromonosporaceae bacterium]
MAVVETIVVDGAPSRQGPASTVHHRAAPAGAVMAGAAAIAALIGAAVYRRRDLRG